MFRRDRATGHNVSIYQLFQNGEPHNQVNISLCLIVGYSNIVHIVLLGCGAYIFRGAIFIFLAFEPSIMSARNPQGNAGVIRNRLTFIAIKTREPPPANSKVLGVGFWPVTLKPILSIYSENSRLGHP